MEYSSQKVLDVLHCTGAGATGAKATARQEEWGNGATKRRNGATATARSIAIAMALGQGHWGATAIAMAMGHTMDRISIVLQRRRRRRDRGNGDGAIDGLQWQWGKRTGATAIATEQ